MTPKLTPLPPVEAIAFFRSKGLETSFAWQDVWQDEHAKAFTVAKVLNRDLLETYRTEVEAAISNGTTFETFQKAMRAHLKTFGLDGPTEIKDPATGEVATVNLASRRRLRTVFDTNLRSAYAAGQWQRIQRTAKSFPFLMYDAVNDGRTRPEHRAMDGHIARVDDPIWDRWYPPCGWRCRCGVIQLTDRMAAAQGGESPPRKFQPQTFVNRRTGEVTTGDKGIDPGFNYNVGKSPLRPLSATAPVTVAAPEGAQAAIDGFLGALNATEPRVIQDRDNWPLVVGPDLFRDKGGRLTVPRPDLIDRLPDVGAALATPSSAAWVWRTANKTDLATPEAVRAAVEAAIASPSATSRVAYAFVAPEVVEAGREAGLDLFGFRHSLTGDKIRHINNRHGVGRERDSKQFDITSDDIAGLAQVVGAPDVVIFGSLTKAGRPTIISLKQLGDSTKIYVEEIAAGRWELTAQTLYHRKGKVPAESNVPALLRSLNINVRNVGENGLKVVDLRGKINPARDPREAPQLVQLIRRYTKRVDNALITIDFARDSWTFDIAPDPKP